MRYLLDPNFTAEFYLTQVVSHHSVGAVERFIRECDRAGVTAPGMFGVFFYRSANPRTLAGLSQFLPVPVNELTREFAEGATAEEICARTLRALMSVGARHFYISNLPLSRATATLSRIMALVPTGERIERLAQLDEPRSLHPSRTTAGGRRYRYSPGPDRGTRRSRAACR